MRTFIMSSYSKMNGLEVIVGQAKNLEGFCLDVSDFSEPCDGSCVEHLLEINREGEGERYIVKEIVEGRVIDTIIG